MSTALAMFLNAVLMVAMLATLAFVMAWPRKLKPHRPSDEDSMVRSDGREPHDSSPALAVAGRPAPATGEFVWHSGLGSTAAG